jgi:hypothetical protein
MIDRMKNLLAKIRRRPQNSEMLVEPDQMPDELKSYSRAIEEHQDHPVIRNFFREIKHLSIQGKGGHSADFFVIEIRIENKSVLAWQDSEDNWGCGDLIFLPEDDSDLAEEGVSVEYFQNARAHKTFEGVLEFIAHFLRMLEETDPERKVIRFKN